MAGAGGGWGGGEVAVSEGGDYRLQGASSCVAPNREVGLDEIIEIFLGRCGEEAPYRDCNKLRKSIEIDDGGDHPERLARHIVPPNGAVMVYGKDGVLGAVVRYISIGAREVAKRECHAEAEVRVGGGDVSGDVYREVEGGADDGFLHHSGCVRARGPGIVDAAPA